MVPRKDCAMETQIIPSLEPREECVDVPKEICATVRVNPRQVSTPVVKKWCGPADVVGSAAGDDGSDPMMDYGSGGGSGGGGSGGGGSGGGSGGGVNTGNRGGSSRIFADLSAVPVEGPFERRQRNDDDNPFLGLEQIIGGKFALAKQHVSIS